MFFIISNMPCMLDIMPIIPPGMVPDIGMVPVMALPAPIPWPSMPCIIFIISAIIPVMSPDMGNMGIVPDIGMVLVMALPDPTPALAPERSAGASVVPLIPCIIFIISVIMPCISSDMGIVPDIGMAPVTVVPDPFMPLP